MKRILCLLLAALFCIGAFCSCDINQKPVTLEDSIPIPEDGIVSAPIFEKIKSENKVVTFYGASGDVRYEWTVFGSDIEHPADKNLAVEIFGETDSAVSFRLLSEEALGFSPVLSLYLTDVWNVQSATVYQKSNAGLSPVCSASVTGSKTSVLNFSVTETGSFTVLVDEEKDTTAAAESVPESTADVPIQSDPYLSEETQNGGRILSDGKQSGQDQYKTDPIPAGKPLPVEPEDQNIDEKQTYTCTFSIECSSILNNLSDLVPEKLDVLPKNGVIFPAQTVTFYEGESVFDVLQRICRKNNIHMEASWTPIYNSAYVEGIHNLYEFDCGSGSGWMYRVNGWYPNYGCSRYQLSQGDTVEWRYTCDLGADIGGAYAINPE
ncbi:MAG: DUF4430 domain-containing protein [Clostridiales bacterium]|nr:DUF4430 domain-containing protein [Clostridiales bacterium]